MLCLFKFSHPNRCVVVPLYSFNLHFFNEKSCCVLFHLLICHNSISVWVYSNLLLTFLKKWVVLFLLSFGRFLYILDISSSSYAWFKIFSLYHNTITIIMVIDYYVKCSFLLVSCTSLIFIDIVDMWIHRFHQIWNFFSLYFFKYFFQSLSSVFEHSDDKHIRHLKLFHISLILYSFKKNSPLFLCIILIMSIPKSSCLLIFTSGVLNFHKSHLVYYSRQTF